MTNIIRRPLVPEDQPTRRPSVYLERAIFAHTLAATAFKAGSGDITSPENAALIARKLWGGDSGAEMILRGAVAPATTTNQNWAGVLSRDAVGDFFATMGPLGAGGQVLNAAPRVSLGGIHSIKFPKRDGSTAPKGFWVAEDAPIPNVPVSLKYSATLGPTHKCACITIQTRELVESSNSESVIRTLMREGISLALDTKLFSSDAETLAAPAGLLNGVAPLTATAGGGNDAMLGDLDKIGGAIAPYTTNIIYVAHPSQAGYVKRRLGWAVGADTTVLPSPGVALGTIIGLDPQALATGYGPDPEIRSTNNGVIHESDTPVAIGSPGSPPVIAAPSRDLYQTDCVATLMILRAAWTWRAENCVAWISGTTWGNAT